MKSLCALAFVVLLSSSAHAQQFKGWQPNFGPQPVSPPQQQPLQQVQQPQTVYAPNGQTYSIHDNGPLGKTVYAPNGKVYNVK